MNSRLDKIIKILLLIALIMAIIIMTYMVGQWILGFLDSVFVSPEERLKGLSLWESIFS